MATTSQEYTLERKTGADTSEEIQIPASSVSGLANVATSGSYNDLSNKPTIPDISGKANLSGGNTFDSQQLFEDITGTTTINGSYVEIQPTGAQGAYSFEAKNSNNTIAFGVSGDSTGRITIGSPIELDNGFGTSGQVLTSQGSGEIPTWTTVPTSFDDLTRIKKQGYAGNNNAIQYFKLASFPVYNSSGNYASFIITGRMGGWQADNMSFVNMILYNRGAEGGGYINVDNSAFYSLCDVVIYRETNGASTAYLKVNGYYTFDINVNTFQATNVYTGTAVTPTGTLKWTASSQADRFAVSDGKAYINGFTMPKQVKINGTAHNPDANAVIDLGTVITDVSGKLDKSAFSLSGTTLTITL